MDKSLYWLADNRTFWNTVRIMRNGKRKEQNNYQHKGNTYMSKLRSSFLELIRTIGDNSGCHQLPERSFFYKGKQFPVCARCTGVFFGQLAALIYGFFSKTSVIMSLCCLGIMGTDWTIQEIGMKQSTNIRRLITGFLGGFGLFSLYFSIFRKIFINSK